ncbi:hypothetical protein Tco_0276499 [Tanacetum coccineum]
MASLNYCLNPFFTIKECSSCGALYTRNCGCSKGSLEDKILVPVPDSSQRPPHNCTTCGDPVDGLYCRPCAFVRKCLNEGWYTIHDENEILNTSESSNDNTNIVSAPQEPFVFNQDPGQNSSRSPPHIDHHCCYECGDSLNDIFCQRCTLFDHLKPAVSRQEYDHIPPNEKCMALLLVEERFLKIKQTMDVCSMIQQEVMQELLLKLMDDLQILKGSQQEKKVRQAQTKPKAIIPDLPTVEPEDSLIMGGGHLDTIPEKESDELIKSSVENLVPIPSESEDFSKNKRWDIFSKKKGDSISSSNPFLEDALVEIWLYDKSSPRPPKELNLEIADTIIESLSPPPILVEDSDSLIEEIDLFLAFDDSMPPGIEDDDYDSEGDIRCLEEFLNNDSLPLLITLFPSLNHFTLIFMMIHHFLVLLQNHRMLRIA